MSIYQLRPSDFQDRGDAEDALTLYCVCGHTDEEHDGEPVGDESGDIGCEICCCKDFTLADERDYEPEIIAVKCEACGRTFNTVDEGQQTETFCGCHRETEILF